VVLESFTEPQMWAGGLSQGNGHVPLLEGMAPELLGELGGTKGLMSKGVVNG